MRKLKPNDLVFLVLLLGALGTGGSRAEPAPAGQRFVPVMTRLMKVLGDKEMELQRAIAQGRRADVEALLTDDFAEQAAGAQVVSTPYAEWIDAALSRPQPLASDAVHVVSAREFGGFTALSFKYQGKSSGHFVVDIWKNIGSDQWKLAARYSTPVAVSNASGSPRPTGKE